MADEQTILKVLIGSQAHGLAAAESDADYRSVYVLPTTELFRVGFRPQGPRLSKDNGDLTAWEVGLFLNLALECYPLVLETLLAPIVEADAWGQALRELFPALWEPQLAHDAFLNYAQNQRKKFLDKKDGRPEKYAAAYIRVLYNLCELLENGRFTVRIVDTPIGPEIARLKSGAYRVGEMIDLGEQWTAEAAGRLARCRHRPDRNAVDEFAVRLRKAFLT